MSEWRDTSLGDLCVRVTSGGTPKRARADYYARADQAGHLWVKSSELRDSYVATTGERLTDRGLAESAAKLIPENSVLIAMYGATAGRVGLLTNQASVNQAVCALIFNKELAEPVFVFHALRSMGDSLASKAAGAAQQNLNAGLIRSFRLPMPTTATQRRIGAILTAFDELIAINERRIQLLEDLARSIYREWFLPHATAAAWGTRNLFEIADVGFGFSFQSRGFGAAGPNAVVRIRDVPKGETSTFTREEAGERYSVRDGDVLIGMDGEFHLNRWSGDDAWLNQRVARLRPKPGICDLHVMLAVAAPITKLNQTITGTTVAHLGKRHLEQIDVPFPDAGALAEVTATLDPIGRAIIALRQGTRRFATTRDLLLPRLVTGRLDISGIDLGDLLAAETA